uniref:Uncharacterized protein n=1 Tax=Ditylum brightwellii TaxID=49249 RepID=A0A7S4SK33_9STRA
MCIMFVGLIYLLAHVVYSRARLAQSEERSAFNRVVVGSIPTSGVRLFHIVVTKPTVRCFDQVKEQEILAAISFVRAFPRCGALKVSIGDWEGMFLFTDFNIKFVSSQLPFSFSPCYKT